MGRKPTPPDQILPRNHKGRTVCTYRGEVYDFGPWDIEGDRPTGDSLSAFREQIDRWRDDPDAEQRAAGERLASVWADWLKGPHAPADRRGENARCGRALFGTTSEPGPFAGVETLGVTSAAVLAWQDELCRRQLSRYTVKRYVALLRACLAWGRVAGRVPAAVVEAVALVPPPPEAATKATAVRPAAGVRAFARTVRRISGGAAVLLRVGWYTGARPGELRRLAVGDVRASGVVRPAKGQGVDLAAAGVWAAVVPAKSARFGCERCLFFGPRCQILLAPLLAGRPASAPLFPTRDGVPYTAKALRDAVKRASRRAGVPVLTPYQLRHAVAERVQARFSGEVPGAGHMAAAAYLGHKPRGVTAGYSGADWVTAARVAKLVG